jgi:hypothetical protein
VDSNLDLLVRNIDQEVGRGGCQRLDPTPTAAEIEIAAAWKRKTWGHIWGVAVVSLGRFTNHPGDFAHCLKRRVARAIGYFFLLHRVSLQLVIFGRGILGRSEELQVYMEGSAARISLPSIHVVDLEVGSGLDNYPEGDGCDEEILQPVHQREMQAAAILARPLRYLPQGRPVRLRLAYSRAKGRAARSVSFEGGSGAEFVALVDRGVTAFVHGHQEG